MTILHPSLQALRGFAADELPPAHRRRTADHLAECVRCRAQVAQLRELRRQLREATALALPADAWARIRARRQAGDDVILPLPAAARAGAGARQGGGGHRALRRAAALLLVAAGAASASLPGSPLRAWWERAHGETPAAEQPTVALHAPTATAPADDTTAGEVALSVAPSRGAVRIFLEAPDPALRLRVRLADADEVAVAARGLAAGALFRSGPGRLEIAEAGAGELRITLPRGLASATLLIDGRTYLRKVGGELRVLAPSADTAGSEILFGVQP